MAIREKANKFADKTLDATESAVEYARNAKNRADARYGSKLDDAESTLSETAENVGRKLRETYESSRESLEEGTEYARRTVARNPLAAVAGAFLGGMLAASLLRRR